MSELYVAGNRLHEAASLYLRQHAGDPVAWQPWDETALGMAVRDGKPILLSIGYSACHWCHVMARESFSDPATAAMMNRLFVCIKVDREERPDLDRTYLGALARIGRQAGWPLTAFLTPEGVAYGGGGYYPPVASLGMPAFTTALEEASRQFRNGIGPEEGEAGVGRNRSQGTTTVSTALLDRVAHELARSVDWLYGGFGLNPPKFLHAAGHELLLRAWARTGEPGLFDAAIGSLAKICDGAVYDHVGGGFHRYAVDDRWRVPHFEKMLCDNALMLSMLVRAWQASHQPVFAARVAHMVTWLLREMRLADGTFASSLAANLVDGDAMSAEDRLYTWAPGEIDGVLGNAVAVFGVAYGESREGPFAPRAVLYRREADAIAEDGFERALAALLRHRDERARPQRDDKVMADWNGLVIAALVEAGLAFGRPDWVSAGRCAFTGILTRLTTPGGLRHCAFEQLLGPPAFLEDYACMAQAALALYEATADERFLLQTRISVDALDAAFWDEAGGYCMTSRSHGPDTTRQVLIDETAAPSGNGTMLGVLGRLACLTGEARYRQRAEALTRRFADRLTRASIAGATALNNSSAVDRLVQVVVVGDPSDAGRVALVEEVVQRFVPDRLLVIHDLAVAVAPSHPASGKVCIGGKATVYVCVGVTCLLPMTDPTELASVLSGAMRV